jgi:hypothetical protein
MSDTEKKLMEQKALIEMGYDLDYLVEWANKLIEEVSKLREPTPKKKGGKK